MSWAKLCDGWWTHPKVIRAGPVGACLHAKALSYAGQHLTDGYIPKAMIHVLGVGIEDPVALADALVELRLFDKDPKTGDYLVHNYLLRNPSRVQVEAERKAAKARAQKAANARWNAPGIARRSASSNADAMHPSNAPDPTPSLKGGEGRRAAPPPDSGAARPPPEFPDPGPEKRADHAAHIDEQNTAIDALRKIGIVRPDQIKKAMSVWQRSPQFFQEAISTSVKVRRRSDLSGACAAFWGFVGKGSSG